MSMILRYGTHEFDTTTAGVTIARQALETNAGIMWAVEETWNITGYLRADNGNPKSLDDKIQALEAALSRAGQDCVWLHSDGTPTAHSLKSSELIGGTRVSQPQYPERNGVEYVTLRNFSIDIKGLRAVNGVDQSLLTQFQETVDYDVLSPIKGHVETLDIRAQFQTLRRFPTYTAVQSGSAVGAFAMPSVPAPRWPDKLIQPGKFTPGTPRYVGNSAVEYPVSWSYQYQSNTPFV